MTKAKPITEAEVERLQEASEDVVYLTSQGYTPTDAIAKVASIGKLTKDQTNLLVHAYSAGLAAEKRASSGGPFTRLGEYELPDPDKVMEIVFGRPADAAQKEAAAFRLASFDSSNTSKTASTKLAFDLRHLDKDLSMLSSKDVKELFQPGTKTAESCSEDALTRLRKPGSGVSMTSITVSVAAPKKEECKEDDGFVHSIPQTVEEAMKAGLKMMSPELSDTIDSVLRDMIKKSAAAKTSAISEASIEYAKIGGLVTNLGRRLQRHFDDPVHKAAGLASVRAYYPEVADLLCPFVNEVLGARIKSAKYDVLALSRNHEFIPEAKVIQEQINKVAELTVKANDASEHYNQLVELYDTRPRGQRADWAKFAFFPLVLPALGIGAAATVQTGKAIKNTVDNRVDRFKEVFSSPAFGGEDTSRLQSENQAIRSAENAAERDKQFSDLTSLSSLLSTKNIGTLSMLNDFKTNDPILKAYPMHEIIASFNELIKTMPHVMRDKSLARALLHQSMSQGRFAPTELSPMIELDSKLMDRYNASRGVGTVSRGSRS